MIKTVKAFTTIAAAAFIAIAASCKSTPDIPTNLTYTQLIQMGQDSMEMANYTAAEAYFNAVIQRYGMDTNIYIEAKYELGHLYLNQKKYSEAYKCFAEIKDIYEQSDYGTLQMSYKKLCEICIDRIPEKYQNVSE